MATITPRGNGKFLARVRLAGQGSVSKTFNDKRTAHTWALETEDAIIRGVYRWGQQDVPTLGKALTRYQREITPLKRGADREKYVIKTLQGLAIATKPLDQIAPVMIARLRDAWLKQVSPSTVQKRHALLSHLYNIAIREWGLDLQNPLLRVSKPKVANQRTRLISAQELEAILAASPNATLKAVARLAWHSAARLGELVNLQWRHVDLKVCTMAFMVTKNGSARVAPLVPEAVALLESLKPKTQQPPTARVFDTSSLAMSKAWAAAVKKAHRIYAKHCEKNGLPLDDEWLIDAHFHDLRHAALTRLAEYGLSTLKLAAISGHKSLPMLSRYTHIRAESLAQELARLEGVAKREAMAPNSVQAVA